MRHVGYEEADMIGRKVIGLFDDGEFDVATLFYSRFKVRDRPDPDSPRKSSRQQVAPEGGRQRQTPGDGGEIAL